MLLSANICAIQVIITISNATLSVVRILCKVEGVVELSVGNATVLVIRIVCRVEGVIKPSVWGPYSKHNRVRVL